MFEFGPLNQWMNNYWGGAFSAAAGCLVFGALPGFATAPAIRDGVFLGSGLALHLLSRPYESVFLLLSVPVVPGQWFFRARPPAMRCSRPPWYVCPPSESLCCRTGASRATGPQLPYSLSQYQYGVPAALTFQRTPEPHVPSPRSRNRTTGCKAIFIPGTDTIASYFERLAYRTRYYRFYFYPPLYLALIAFVVGIRNYRQACIPLVCLLFALGINFFPAFQFHYMAAVICLFVLMSVMGLQRLTGWPWARKQPAS